MNGIFFQPPLESNFIGHQMAEVYKDRVYAPYLEGKKDLTIIDIGANVGVVSYYFSQFAKQVFSLEPSKEHFEVLTAMLAFNKITNVKPINKAIFMKSGKFPFGGPNDNKTMRSLHMSTWQDNKPLEDVDCITLEDLFRDEKIEHCDLMKLDVEGSEYEILGSPSFKLVAPKIDVVIGESHKWAGRNENQLRESFKNNGFEFEWLKADAQLFVAKK